jgi:signal transduction histidine kinase
METMTRTEGGTRGGMRAIGSRERLAILAFWTCFGLLESAKAYVSTRLRGSPSTWAHALAGNMPWWFMWALLTPAVFALARRYRLDRRPAGGAIAVHAVASAGSALVHIIPVGALYFFTHARFNPDGPPLPTMLRNFVDGYGLLDMLTYWAIVGGYYALEFHRRMRATELEASRLQLQAAELRGLTQEARLHALRMELNPHFLFNALNAISGLVRRSDRDTAVAMLARLGDLLRVTLRRDTAEVVTLERELECLDLYLQIERVRFSDRLHIDIDVPDPLRDALVPTLILQPLVENAVRHGIAPTPGPGTIRIQARPAGDQLRIAIADTGPGWNGDQPRGEGLGLSNTRARLVQLYGDAASLLAGAAHGGGTIVTLILPYRAAEPARERALVAARTPVEIP